MIEIARVLEWIYDTLSADSTLTGLVSTRIYDGLAPQGAAFPFVVFNHQGGSDLRGVGSERVFNNSLYQVKAVTKGGSFSSGATIADRIDALLQAASGTTSDGVILGCVREQAIMLIEQQSGVEYRHVGGIYRIYAQEL